MRSLDLTKAAFLARSFDVVDFEDGSVIIESPEHRNFVGTWNESVVASARSESFSAGLESKASKHAVRLIRPS